MTHATKHAADPERFFNLFPYGMVEHHEDHVSDDKEVWPDLPTPISLHNPVIQGP